MTWAVEHEHIAGVLGRLLWGTGASAFYRDIARRSELPAATPVLDIPCGEGAAFRGLQPEQELETSLADSGLRLPVEAEKQGRQIDERRHPTADGASGLAGGEREVPA